MSDSTLDPDNIPVGTDRTLGRGHGARALGPSDNSDSGSDVAGDPDVGFDSDTDAEGTGERAGVEPASVAAGSDIGFDHIESADGTILGGTDADFDDAAVVEEDDDSASVDDDGDPAQREERRDWARAG